MLAIPESYNGFSILSIDPGLSECGVARFEFADGKISSILPLTFVNSRIRFESGFTHEAHSDREDRVQKLKLAYRSVLEQARPSLICCESPFYNPRMPSAFGSLTEVVSLLRSETFEFNPHIPFLTYSPQEVKQTFKQSGKLGKLVMKEALAEDTFLMSKLLLPIENLDEHAVDAIAVGYTWVKRNS